MGDGLKMVLHAALVALAAFLFMVFYFKQKPDVAEQKAVLFGAVILMYKALIVNGQLNPHIFR